MEPLSPIEMMGDNERLCAMRAMSLAKFCLQQVSKTQDIVFRKRECYPLGNFLESLLFVLRFYGPVNPMGSCQARSVYLTTCLLGRLSPLSG